MIFLGTVVMHRFLALEARIAEVERALEMPN
jgi:hypothetical protein